MCEIQHGCDSGDRNRTVIVEGERIKAKER